MKGQLIIDGPASTYHFIMGSGDVVFREYLVPVFNAMECPITTMKLEGERLTDFRNRLVRILRELLRGHRVRDQRTTYHQQVLGKTYGLNKGDEVHWAISALGHLVDNADSSLAASEPMHFTFHPSSDP